MIFRRGILKKIVIVGPESTGKSVLCEQLAKHYKTLWCPEFAREYLLTHEKNYTYNDLLTIAKGQLAIEDKHESTINYQLSIINSTTPLLFIDTDMYVMKVWCEFVFNKCHAFILNEIVKRKYDLYLLCDVDLPWQQDALREYPDVETRKKLYHIYKDLLINQPVPWVNISGKDDERLQCAIHAIENYMQLNS